MALCAQTAVLFEAECKERGLEYTVSDGEHDATKQIDDINALIQKNVDALLILPTDGNAVAAGVEAAYEAGIPVFVILRDMPTVKDKYVAFSGTDDVELGKIAGQWIVDAIGETGNIVYITGTPGLSTAENRTTGFHSIVDQYPNVKVIAEQAGNYNRATAMDVMAAILQANADIAAVWCANDEMAGGAIQAIDAAGRNGILVGGANLQKDAYNRLLDGTQAADVTTPPQMVIAALDAAMAYLNGEQVEKTLLYPLDLVTKDNAAQFEEQIY
jgi:ribose transport system substrate-binding protein